MSSDIKEVRKDVVQITSDLRAFVQLLDVANLSLASTIGYLRVLGLPENVEDAAVIFQTFIITIQTLRIALRKLQIEIGPAGWAMIFIGTVAGLTLTREMEMRSPEY